MYKRRKLVSERRKSVNGWWRVMYQRQRVQNTRLNIVGKRRRVVYWRIVVFEGGKPCIEGEYCRQIVV